MVFALTLHRCALPGGEGAVTCIGFVRLCTFVSLPCIWAVATQHTMRCPGEGIQRYVSRKVYGRLEGFVQASRTKGPDLFRAHGGLSRAGRFVLLIFRLVLCVLCFSVYFVPLEFTSLTVILCFQFQLDFAFHSFADYNKSIAIVMFCSLS